MVKNSPANAGDARATGLIPGSVRSPRGGNGNPLQYSCLENPMERSLMGYSPWVQKESDTTKHADTHTPAVLEFRMRQEFLPTLGISMGN